jgi:hypothetical protein
MKEVTKHARWNKEKQIWEMYFIMFKSYIRGNRRITTIQEIEQ